MVDDDGRDGDVLVGAWRQLAAARVIQRWIRTRFQPWLQKCQPLRRGGPSEPACELFYEDHIGPPTIEKNLDVGTDRPGGDSIWFRLKTPYPWPSAADSADWEWTSSNTLPSQLSEEAETADFSSSIGDQLSIERLSTPLLHAPAKNVLATPSEKAFGELLHRPGGDSTWFRLKTPYPWPSAAESADWEWTSSNTLPSQLSEEAETADFSSSIGDQLSIERLSTPLLHAPAKNVLATPSEKAFGELLRECKHATPMTFDAVLEDIGAEGCVKLHEGGVYSEVFRTCGSRGAAVLKVLHPGYLREHLQQLLTEVRVARILRKMSMNVDNNTGGFAELRAVYAVWDKYPYMMRNACINYHSRKNFSLFGDEERETSKPYVVMYMSFAGRPLSKVQFASTLQIRSVVQQLALTIAIGETALEFEHRALTPAHVLVKEAHDQVAAFWLDGRPLLVDMFGVQVTVVDFSTARLKSPSEDSQALFADLTKLSEEKWVSLGDSFATAYSMIREDLSQFYPWTNMVYLEALTRMLVKTHEGRFASAADEAERQAWRDVCFWLGEMPHYGTTRDFACELIVQSARSTTSLSSL
ncbi:serine/threonine-protein kinase haspin-like [Dermacentor silvarum]|uniref:serine/threonine-protein kinase haspin-like n=1 Tax=Dermacentor silvarum TaxID=543639 RepID=UPI001899E0A4|nr:serine/threonine-protein kinase haspin-like [Dermacentor silvarum]